MSPRPPPRPLLPTAHASRRSSPPPHWSPSRALARHSRRLQCLCRPPPPPPRAPAVVPLLPVGRCCSSGARTSAPAAAAMPRLEPPRSAASPPPRSSAAPRPRRTSSCRRRARRRSREGDQHHSRGALLHHRSAAEERAAGKSPAAAAGMRAEKHRKGDAGPVMGLMVPDPKQMQYHQGSGHHKADHGGSPGSSSAPKPKPKLKPAAQKVEFPRIFTTLSRKEKEDDFMAIKGAKLPQRPKKRPKGVEKAVNFVCPGMWLTDVTRSRYVVREKRCTKKQKHWGLKGLERMDSESD